MLPTDSESSARRETLARAHRVFGKLLYDDRTMSNDQFSATFVPDQDSPSPEELVATLSDRFELAAPPNENRAHFMSGEVLVVLSWVVEPRAIFLVLHGPSPDEVDQTLDVLESSLSRASAAQLRALAEDGNPLLWAVAQQGEPNPVEVEQLLWEQTGSPNFEERLLAAEAARMLGSPGALLAIECCALVELGPIRAVFESYLFGTSRRSLSRERRVLLDPSVPLPDQLEQIHPHASSLPGASVFSSVGYASTYFEWQGDTDRVYVLDADHPTVRWLGFDGPNTAPFQDLASFSVSEGLERSHDPNWLRAVSNVVTRNDAANLLATLEQQRTNGTSSFELAFSAIESAIPDAWKWLAEHLSTFDERLIPVAEQAGIRPA